MPHSKINGGRAATTSLQATRQAGNGGILHYRAMHGSQTMYIALTHTHLSGGVCRQIDESCHVSDVKLPCEGKPGRAHGGEPQETDPAQRLRGSDLA